MSSHEEEAKKLLNELTPRITGSIVTRTQGPESRHEDGRILVAFVGIMAVPEGHVFDSEGKQFAFAGMNPGMMLPLVEVLYTETKPMADVASQIHGQRLDYALTIPIWRV